MTAPQADAISFRTLALFRTRMRVAVSGTHATGKSTLVVELARHLPGYRVVEEPYYKLLDEGELFAGVPSTDDFEQLLARSVAELEAERARKVLFDRCPADYLGYLAALGGVAESRVAPWFNRVCDAIATLDLVVFVPIERPDRIDGKIEQRRLRKRVHEEIREILVDDAWKIGVPVVEVSGTVEERVWQVLARMQPGRAIC